MDHIVWLDAESNELNNLIIGTKSMIIFGANNKKDVIEDIEEGDRLYLVSDLGESLVEATAMVKCVFYSDELTVEESFETIIKNQAKLQLPDLQFEKYAGKKFIVLIELSDVEAIKPIHITYYENKKDNSWLSVGKVTDLVRETRSY
jgi:hypothetical protein